MTIDPPAPDRALTYEELEVRVAGLSADVSRLTAHRELLEKLDSVLAPLDSKIDHSLWAGTVEQMRADLSYMRGLFQEARAAIQASLRDAGEAGA